MSLYAFNYPRLCGCYYTQTINNRLQRTYLPQVQVDVRTTVLSTSSRTVLKQTFINPDKKKPLGEIRLVTPETIFVSEHDAD